MTSSHSSASREAGDASSDGSPTATHVVIATPVLLGGGTEVQTLALASALVELGCRVTVCCYHEHHPDIVARFEALGAKVILMRLARARGLLRLILSLRRLFRQLHPSAIHVQYLAPGLAPIVAARLARIPRVLATVHAVYPSRRAKVLIRVGARLCDGFSCVSRAVETFWFGSSRLPEGERPADWRGHYTLYNCVDADSISRILRKTDGSATRREYGLEGFTVGVVGRLAPEKGHDTLIEALPLIAASVPGVKVLVVGDGPLRTPLAQLAERLGVSDRICWVGARSHEETIAHLAAMDVLAVPSRLEGFGLSAAEAMAGGVPVVATRVQGLTEVVAQGETGVLVPADDPAALADAIVGVVRDPGRKARLGHAAMARARELYSRSRYVRSVMRAYAGVGLLLEPSSRA